MTSGAALVDSFEDLVTTYARLPPGSAAAFDAAALVLTARTILTRRMAEDAAEIAKLRRALLDVRELALKAALET